MFKNGGESRFYLDIFQQLSPASLTEVGSPLLVKSLATSGLSSKIWNSVENVEKMKFGYQGSRDGRSSLSS